MPKQKAPGPLAKAKEATATATEPPKQVGSPSPAAPEPEPVPKAQDDSTSDDDEDWDEDNLTFLESEEEEEDDADEEEEEEEDVGAAAAAAQPSGRKTPGPVERLPENRDCYIPLPSHLWPAVSGEEEQYLLILTARWRTDTTLTLIATTLQGEDIAKTIWPAKGPTKGLTQQLLRDILKLFSRKKLRRPKLVLQCGDLFVETNEVVNVACQVMGKQFYRARRFLKAWLTTGQDIPLRRTAGVEAWNHQVLEVANLARGDFIVTQHMTQRRTAEGQLSLVCKVDEVVMGLYYYKPTRSIWCVKYRNGLRCEGLIPESCLQPAPVYEFGIEVEEDEVDSVGIRGTLTHDGLLVTQVEAKGFARKWNEGCALTFPRDMIRVGDVVVQVDNMTDYAGMLSLLLTTKFSELHIKRPRLRATTFIEPWGPVAPLSPQERAARLTRKATAPPTAAARAAPPPPPPPLAAAAAVVPSRAATSAAEAWLMS